MAHSSKSARRRGFQIHAGVFVPTLVLLVVINLLTGQPYWVLWVFAGWTIGLIAHWWFVLGPGADNTADQ